MKIIRSTLFLSILIVTVGVASNLILVLSYFSSTTSSTTDYSSPSSSDDNHGITTTIIQALARPKKKKKKKTKTKLQKQHLVSKNHNNHTTSSSPSSAYRHPIPEPYRHSNSRNGKIMQQQRPAPITIMEQYIQWHGVDALRKEVEEEEEEEVGGGSVNNSRNRNKNKNNPSSSHNRKYALALYACPHAAGNRIHEYTNYMLWAVVTNRTLLWKYLDAPTIATYGPKLGFRMLSSNQGNAQEECDRLLVRAPWMAEYDEWAPKLGLLDSDGDNDDDSVVVLPPQSTRPSYVGGGGGGGRGRPYNQKKQLFGVDVTYEKHRIVLFPHRTNAYDFLSDSKTRNRKLQTKYGRYAAEQLYKLGTNFLYGMLFRYAFDFAPKIRQSSHQLLLPGDDEKDKKKTNVEEEENGWQDYDGNHLSKFYSIAIHSRHNDTKMNGCDIFREQSCILELLKKNKSNRPCRVVIMSDRPCTIDRLGDWLQHNNCTFGVADHDTGQGLYDEHGPYAGAGYFQDLELASALTRNAVVGTTLDETKFGSMWRSSSALLREMVAFYRGLDSWVDGEKKEVRDDAVNTCLMPRPSV